jgi:aspartokinase
MVVMKFGGNSVGDVMRFASVSRIIQDARDKYERVVVVVSAMSGVTNSRLKAARAAAEGDEGIPLRVVNSIKKPQRTPRSVQAIISTKSDIHRPGVFGV